MSTLLLVSIAIGVPLFLVLTSLAPLAPGDVESETRSWRIAAKIGSVLLLLMAASLFVFGSVIFVKAMTSSDRWSFMAVALYPVTEGARSIILFFPSMSGAAVNQLAVSYFVRAGGYCVITLFLLVASMVESLWCLPFAGLASWFAGISVYLGRSSTRSGAHESSVGA